MIRIAITAAAFDAIAKTLPVGSVGYEAESDAKGERLIWIDDRQADKLGAMRGPGESYSDVILLIAGQGDAGHDDAATLHFDQKSRSGPSPRPRR
jgi:hypothetical protein